VALELDPGVIWSGSGRGPGRDPGRDPGGVRAGSGTPAGSADAGLYRPVRQAPAPVNRA